MAHTWLRRAALCAAFCLFAQTVHAQVYIPGTAGAAARKPTPITDSLAQKPDPEAEARKIMDVADDSWMNGWMIAGVTALAGGVWAIVKSDNMKSEVWDDLDRLVGTRFFPSDVDQWFQDNSGDARTLEKVGIGLAVGGVALMAGGHFFADRGIQIKKTPGGFTASKTIKLGKK